LTVAAIGNGETLAGGGRVPGALTGGWPVGRPLHPVDLRPAVDDGSEGEAFHVSCHLDTGGDPDSGGVLDVTDEGLQGLGPGRTTAHEGVVGEDEEASVLHETLELETPALQNPPWDSR
jgi:hypothetical protein